MIRNKMIDKFKVEIDMEQDMCFICKKTSPEYYELKLQLRFSFFNNIDDVKLECFNLINKNFDSINKMQELDNGFDFFFRSKGEMNKISTLFNKKYLVEEKRSKKIVGRNFLESKDIYRHIILINIINFKKGDILNIKGEKYTIKAINKNDLVLIHLINGSKKVISYKFIKDYLDMNK